MSRLEMSRRLNECEHLKQAEAIFAEIGAEWNLEEARSLLLPLAEKSAT
jgi:hypothetical protein